MKKNDEVKPEEKEKYYQEGIDWDYSLYQSNEKSKILAWRISICQSVLLALALIAIAMMMPLKEIQLIPIRVDTTSGIVDSVTYLKDKKVTYVEAMDKYFLSQFIRAREGYDWYTLKDDYEKVRLFSENPIFNEYDNLFRGANSLDKAYGDKVVSRVKILSISLSSNGTASIRFVKRTSSVEESSTSVTEGWIATIAYTYKNPSKMSETDRLINPFGFQVQSYRVDPELVK